MSPQTALFADPDRTFGWKLRVLAQKFGIVAEVCATAEEAKRMLVASSPQLFFTNVRLGQVRGGDLVHLAKMANPRTRAILYGAPTDLQLARQGQKVGAFFEPVAFLRYSLPHYFSPTLPPRDRRDPARLNRRKRFRGGRRASDLEILHHEQPTYAAL
jgi:hypothetical protein